jgi:hypothetical protein
MRISPNTVLLTMGSAMLISSSVAMAAAPTHFGQFTATNTTGTSDITAPCPTGNAADCTGAITGDGFLQRQVTIGGKAYFQTIILEKGATVSPIGGTGPDAAYADLSTVKFADESFVTANNTGCTGPSCGTGIADTSNVYADNSGSGSSDTSVFNTTATILVGDFKDPTDNQIAVDQTIKDPTTTKTNIAFNLTDASTDNSSPVITISSTVYLNQDPSAVPADTDPHQTFYLQQLKVDSASAGGVLPDLATLGSTTTTGTQVSYAANDIIQVLWVGQTVASDTTTTPPSIQAFGVESFSVNPNGYTAPATATATQSYSNQNAVGLENTSTTPSTFNPFAWDTIFGTTQPVF